MRKAITGSILGLGALAMLVAGCTIKEATDTDGGVGGEGGSAGTAGSGGSAGGSNATCGDVPLTGMCKDSSTVSICLMVGDQDQVPEIKTTACGANRKCVADAKGARCETIGQCLPGDIVCAEGYKSILTCSGSGESAKWVETACNEAKGETCFISKPGQPAKCAVKPGNEGGKDYVMKGRIQYEYLKIKSDRKGLESSPTVRDGMDLYVGIFNEKDELIGKALTGYDPDKKEFTYDGAFIAHLSEAPTDKTRLFVWPMAFNYETGMPMMAMVKVPENLKGDDNSPSDTFEVAANATDYWVFGRDGLKPDGNGDIGSVVFNIAEGSGAIHAYEWVDYSLLRTGNSEALGGKKQDSVLVMWDQDVKMDCGACYCPPGCGGGKVKWGGENDVDTYDTWMALSGTQKNSKQWMASTISHEMGHWAMQNYSLSPKEGGPHSLGEKINAAFAYSEGWATGFAQAGIEDPYYVTVTGGTMWWIDLAKWSLYDGSEMIKADPDGPIDQQLDESLVAAMIFKLFVDPKVDPDGRALGDEKVFAAFADPKLANGTYNRGYSKVDLVDFFDVLVCTKNASDDDISAISSKAGYPYKAADRTCH